MDDKDITALRRFRSALDEPDEAMLAARRPVLDPSTSSAGRFRSRWRLVAVPVAAAALVGATVLLVSSILPSASPTGQETPSELPYANSSPSAPSARQVIEQLALLAETAPTPPQPRPDQLILVLQTQHDQVGAHKQERWLDPNGAILLRVRSTAAEGTVDDDTEQERQKWISMFRADMAKVGPGLFYPTWTVLSTYTHDPQVLLRDLTKGDSYNAGTLTHTLGSIAENVDAMAPPRLKAGLLRALGLVDGVTAELVTAPDGSQVWAIGGQQDESLRREVLVSPTTGLIVGYRDVKLVDYVYPGGGPCRTCTPRPTPSRVPIPPTPTNAYMFQTSLVAR